LTVSSDMKKQILLLGLGVRLLAAAHNALAQNASGNQTPGGLGISTNTSGASKSQEAMNNTLYPADPQNETVIAK
jgi:hypothetical protein